MPYFPQAKAKDGFGLSGYKQLEFSGLADNLTLALCGSGDGVLNILLATSDGVGVGNSLAVDIEQNLAITGSGNDGLVLVHGIGDFRSLGDGLQAHVSGPVKPLLVVAVLLNRATARVLTRGAAGVEENLAAFKAFLDFEIEQHHLIIFTSFPFYGHVAYPCSGVFGLRILIITLGGDNRQEVIHLLGT